MFDRRPHLVAALMAAAVATVAYVSGFVAIAAGAAGIALVAIVVALAWPPPEARRRDDVLVLHRAHLNENAFCRHGIVVGQPGTGKTELFRRMLIQLLQTTPDFGGLITDEKGDLHDIVKAVFRAHGALDKLVELRPRQFGAKAPRPAAKMNFLSDRSVSWQSHAQLIVDAAVSQGQKTSQAHFKTQALDRMADAMETLHWAGLSVTIPAVYEFVKYPELFDATLQRMLQGEHHDRVEKERVQVLYEGWRQYLAKAPEELSGIRGTIENYLNPYVEPEIAEVFHAADPTVGIDALDHGKVLLISIPQQFTRARKYHQAYAKILYYRDSLGRFDRPAGRRQNLHVGLFDEGHNSLLASEEGYSDFNTLDKMRSARCAVWFFMQCYTSALPPLERESKLDVLKGNLGTHVIFRLASEKGHKIASGVIGEHEVMEVSRSVSRGVATITRSPKVKPVLGTWVFRKLPDFHAIVRHPTDTLRDYYHVHLPPVTNDGRRIAPWYWKKKLHLA